MPGLHPRPYRPAGLRRPLMPCAPRMRGCRADCLHRRLVQDYRAERERQLAAAEAASAGYAAEWREHVERHPLVTFADWLRWHAERAEHRKDLAA